MGDGGVTRRDVLKGLGAVGAGVLGAGGTTITRDEPQASSVEPVGGTLDIAIYKQRASDEEGARNVRDSLHGFMEDLREHDAIGETNVWVEDTPLDETFGLSYDEGDCDDDPWFAAFAAAVEEMYEADIHLAVTDQSRFANAMNNECWGDNGPGFAYVGTAGGYEGTAGPEEDVKRYENAALQEAGHIAINDVYIEGDDSLSHPEHALGTILTDAPWERSGPSTPMATFYENQEPGADRQDNNPCYHLGEATTKGVCSAPEAVTWDGTHTRELTPCTIQAFQQTYIHDGYGPPSRSKQE